MYMASDSTFYRVSVKALIFDEQDRLLVFQNQTGNWEMPGGGWEHGETLDSCMNRELYEEMHIRPSAVGPVSFVYVGKSSKGYHKLSLAVPVSIAAADFAPAEDNLVGFRYVSPDELRALSFTSSEAPITDNVDKIWPAG
jgi:8-oxo-dGTP pyrophosphatase MutT (NUDIX family)